MQNLLVTLALLVACILPAFANVEKVVFLGPGPLPTNAANANVFRSQFLELLRPDNPSLRRTVRSTFDSSPGREESNAWFLLDGLTEGQRYEARVCWSASVGSISSIELG